jgi:hypothetical protein
MEPLRRPYFSRAITAYSEQLGENLQAFGRIGEMRDL